MWTIPGLVGLVLMLIASAETNGGNQQSLRFETDLKFDDTENASRGKFYSDL